MRSSKAFTLVELLIVIVVIAILAAISIVAYNGIQERARVASVSSALTQAIKKIKLWQVDNPDTAPASLSDADITTPPNVTFQYSRASNNQDYCITATQDKTSYYLNSITQTTPTSGGCPGHGQGGQQAITNLVVNPSAESDISGWEFAGNGNGMVQQSSRPASGGYTENAFGRMTITTPPSSMSNLGIWIAPYATLPSTSSLQYTASLYVRSSQALSIRINAVPYNTSWAYTGGEVSGSTVTLTPNTWIRLSVPITVPAGSQYVRLRARVVGATVPPANTTLDVDGAMLTAGDALYTYSDGNSPNWIWNSTSNNSSSTGPAR